MEVCVESNMYDLSKHIIYVKKTSSQLQNQPERWIANTNKLQIVNWTHRDIVVRPNWWPTSTCSSLGEPFYYIGVSQYIEDHKPVNYTKEISHRVYTKPVSLCPFYTLWCPRIFPRKFSFTRYSPKKRTKKTMMKMSISLKLVQYPRLEEEDNI